MTDPEFPLADIILGRVPSPSGPSQSEGPEAREAALKQIQTMMADPAGPYRNVSHPGHEEAVQQMYRLHQAAHPEVPFDPTAPPEEPEPQPAPTLPADLPALPAGQEWDPLMIQDFQGAVQDLRLTPEESRAVLGYVAGWEPEKAPTIEAAASTLQQEWGDQYEDKLEAARHVYNRLPGSLQTLIDETGLGNDPKLIRTLAHLAEGMLTARDQIEKILADRSHPYHNVMHPQHDKAVRDMQRLYEKVYGTRQVGAA